MFGCWIANLERWSVTFEIGNRPLRSGRKDRQEEISPGREGGGNVFGKQLSPCFPIVLLCELCSLSKAGGSFKRSEVLIRFYIARKIASQLPFLQTKKDPS
jgi:hypothetical protein